MAVADIAALADDSLARSCAGDLRERFADYNARFRAITQRAKWRFEQRDWAGQRADAVERIELYDVCVRETSGYLSDKLAARIGDRALWTRIRDAYAEAIAGLLDQELNKTFFNTLTRRVFGTRGVDADVEFVALDIEPTDHITHPVARYSYDVGGGLAPTLARVLGDYRFAVPYAEPQACARRMADELLQRFRQWGSEPVRGIELMETVFYRERRAYLVGRLYGDQRFAPIVVALRNDADGIRADAVINDPAHVAQVFGFTRAYFHVDLATVGDAVVFLRTLLPRKPLDEIYTVLGRAKQGKTERYRHFFRHLAAHPHERFVHADGERGMVMLVFTLPGYPLVFKVIRDRFAYPKNIVRQDVLDKYQIVFKHDRVGRLVDAQEFRHLSFLPEQFSPALRDELLGDCADTCSLQDGRLVVSHCYVERRLRPLNLYVREVDEEAAKRAVLDYGQAIKDLARSNIFPGDLLLKNFGITRHGRAIFYDYDELALLTTCRFRALPEPSSVDEEMHHGAWFHVGDDDVFPEQFARFLGLRPALLDALMQRHGEIFDVRWWLGVQEGIRNGDYADLPPYAQRLRLAASAPPP
ncbi:MAG TPA: bifunctional isocitrate dehydrogenase kinase/phosphatase [Xanthomonadales bacterium]|nr:bifunctional isocitrate dehydrogenase kinase/phosphatase [Xanthomonadales bacterium]